MPHLPPRASLMFHPVLHWVVLGVSLLVTVLAWQISASSLQSRFSALGETWQDAEHEKFAAEFLTTMKAIKKFMEMSEQHTPFLLRKAQRIEDYLNQR